MQETTRKRSSGAGYGGLGASMAFLDIDIDQPRRSVLIVLFKALLSALSFGLTKLLPNVDQAQSAHRCPMPPLRLKLPVSSRIPRARYA